MNSMNKKKLRISPVGYRPYLHHLIGSKKIHKFFRKGYLFEELSDKSWEIHPGNEFYSEKAYFLTGQLERITGTAYTPNPQKVMMGGHIKHSPTKAYQLKNVWINNGSIYVGSHRLILNPISQLSRVKFLLPSLIVTDELEEASIYNTYDGFKFFGLWLSDDCVTYNLASSFAPPLTSNIFLSPHMHEYERLLKMNPIRSNAAFIKKVTVFDEDWGNNENKHERFSEIRKMLCAEYPEKTHPGVFILRRNSGSSRVMLNEVEIADRMKNEYGFRIVDVTTDSVSDIISNCIGAKFIIGIEGSHLMHGLMVLKPGSNVLTLQPPDRFCGVIKLTTDMENINFGFVIGKKVKDGFIVNYEEIKKTIELFPV